MTKFCRILFILWLLITVQCLGAGAQQLPSPLAHIPQRELELVQRFLKADRGTTNCFTTVVIGEETYTVIMDLKHQKAAILNRDSEKEKSMGEVGARGFFARDSKGAWIRESHAKFEMNGGIWLLGRFLQVLKKTDEATFTRFRWNI